MTLVLKAGVAYLWFITVHPFEDGNGRIVRAIAACALNEAEEILSTVFHKAHVWQHANRYPLNARQRHMINRLLDDFAHKLTSGKYVKLEKCSTDTALLNIKALIAYGILKQDKGGGRSTSYLLSSYTFSPPNGKTEKTYKKQNKKIRENQIFFLFCFLYVLYFPFPFCSLILAHGLDFPVFLFGVRLSQTSLSLLGPGLSPDRIIYSCGGKQDSQEFIPWSIGKASQVKEDALQDKAVGAVFTNLLFIRPDHLLGRLFGLKGTVSRFFSPNQDSHVFFIHLCPLGFFGKLNQYLLLFTG